MDREIVCNALVEAMGEIQKQSGRPMVALTPASIPLTDLPGFDSLNCVEVAVIVEGKIGCEVATEHFIRPGGQKLTIGEIADNICASVSRK
jgi:acyl carrier protein